MVSPAAAIDEQDLTGVQSELGEGTHLNTVMTAVDISTDPDEVIDMELAEGDSNLQDNAFSLIFTSSVAQSGLQQSLLGMGFNTNSAGLANLQERNTVNAGISAPDGVSGTVGVNAAAGVFNIQKNSAAIAAMPGSMLAQSFSSITQNGLANLSLHHDAVNDVTAIITLDSVSGNVGINLASGVGNVQLNSVTTSLSF